MSRQKTTKETAGTLLDQHSSESLPENLSVEELLISQSPEVINKELEKFFIERVIFEAP